MAKKVVVNGKERHLHGWKLDRPDHRDFGFVPHAVAASHMPTHGSLRQFCSQIEDQGEIGSCTANSSTSGMELLYNKLGKKPPQLSRLFVYYATRVWTEHVAASDDAGAMIRDVMKTLATFGTCLETSWPYDITKFSVAPSDEAKREALNHQIIRYYRMLTVEAIESCIYQGYPVVGGFSVPENMMSDEAANTGLIKYPSLKEKLVGGHAVLFVGYDRDKQLIEFQNSWGTGWGSKGFGYLPYKFFRAGLANDFWTIRAEEY